MIAQVSSALAAHLAAGGLFLTAMLSLPKRLPSGFLRFCTGSAAALAGVAALLGSGPPAKLAPAAVGLLAALWYVILRKTGESPRPLAMLAAAVAAFAPALSAWMATDETRWLSVSGTLTSALLLGAVTVTMILGHWYLIDTGLSIAPLRDGALWVSLAVAARWAAVAAALVFGGWEVLRVSRAADLILSTRGLFFLFRSLMGLGAPLLLAALIWQTVKMRSTQSATGLLYVALILVVFGELVSEFLRFTTGYPL